ncbi:MAG: hypothetical protein PWQ55_2715 [Chloroflexota bacterium]|nr:hypothetical protein [Chloroflexota bacterium]
MLKVTQSPDCGNSPKNRLVADTTIALAGRDGAFLERTLSEDVRWEVVGGAVVTGRAAVLQALAEMLPDQAIREISLTHAISHGKQGAVNGSLTRVDGTQVDFCTFYTFSSAKGTAICEIVQYAIPINA